ncbi:mitogen-activated protein kinase kinase kinase 17-like [Durio zibethinus]|uniref:Mitogen-activated protein kinase kinase kinase 17-like n=1 Tax=Durio zibethinus TaxID=66656 RepID=A0A6P6A5R5_DURZI|nr:mitogen-activated protein kinase kinase kinase 17-like [Durio zibethinus]
MDFPLVKGVAIRNGLTMEWIKLKVLDKGSDGVGHMVKPVNYVFDDRVFAVRSCRYEDSSSVQKELEILEQFADCGNIVQCYGDTLSIDQGMLVYNLFLEYAPGGIRDIHDRGYVHCDLKPANIHVFPPDPYGSISNLQIADFGLVRRAGERNMLEA